MNSYTHSDNFSINLPLEQLVILDIALNETEHLNSGHVIMREYVRALMVIQAYEQVSPERCARQVKAVIDSCYAWAKVDPGEYTWDGSLEE